MKKIILFFVFTLPFSLSSFDSPKSQNQISNLEFEEQFYQENMDTCDYLAEVVYYEFLADSKNATTAAYMEVHAKCYVDWGWDSDFEVAV